MDEDPTAVVSTAWLAARLDDPTLKIFDGSWFLTKYGRDPAAEFAAGHIPGAQRFDVDDIADPDSSFPHMLPPPAIFEYKVRALGVDAGDQVIACDGGGLMTAPRVWWMFRAMGHDRVAVLDGALPKWRQEGRPIATGETKPRRTGTFRARYRRELCRNFEDMLANVRTHAEQMLDGRSPGRFHAREPEDQAPRAGHIPGSRVLQSAALVDPATKTFLAAGDLRRVLTTAGIDLGRPVATTCGSGIAACALALGLYLAGNKTAAVYNGSWTEWGGRFDAPIET
ncbi:MAG: sulfurtransferase [Alphaproteobacteria bacterium]|nr:sulfurtransferase [Alphaproteobacteria bacterium]